MPPRTRLTDDEMLVINTLLDQKKYEQAAALGAALRAGAVLPSGALERIRQIPTTPPSTRSAKTVQQIAAENELNQKQMEMLTGQSVREARDAEIRRIVQTEGLSYEDAKAKAEGIVERTVERAVRPPGGLGIRTGDVAGAGGSPRAILEAFRPQPIVRGPEYTKPETKTGQALAWALETTNKATGEVRESLPATALRGIGSLWQFVDVPAMQAATYEVDEQGNPLNPRDPALLARQKVDAAIGPKASAALSARMPTLLAPARRTQLGRGGAETGSYWQDVAQAIAAGRMLGDDLAALPEFTDAVGEKPAWGIGLGVELVRPLSPLSLAGAGARAANVARGVRVAGAIQEGSSGSKLLSATDVARLATGSLDSHTVAAKAADLAAPRVAALVTSQDPQAVESVRRIVAASDNSSPLRRATLEAVEATKGSDGTLVANPMVAAERAARQVLLEAGAEAGLNAYVLVTPTLAVSRKLWEEAGPVALNRARVALEAVASGKDDAIKALLANKRLPQRSYERLARAAVNYDAGSPETVRVLADALVEAEATIAGRGVGLRRTGELATRAAVPEALRWETPRIVEDMIPAAFSRAVKSAAQALSPPKTVEGPIEIANAVARIKAEGATVIQQLVAEHKALVKGGRGQPKLSPAEALDVELAYRGVTLGDALRMLVGPAAADTTEMLDVLRPFGLDPSTVATIEAMQKAKRAIQARIPGALKYATDRKGDDIVTPLVGALAQRRLAEVAQSVFNDVLDTPYSIGMIAPDGVSDELFQRAAGATARGKVIAADPLARVADDVVDELGLRGDTSWVDDLDDAVTKQLFALGLYSTDDMAELVPRLALSVASSKGATTLVGADLAQEMRGLAQQLAEGSVRKSLLERLPANATTRERVLDHLAGALMASRRVMIQGMLGGWLAPNGRFLGTNLVTAPLIVATTLTGADSVASTGLIRLLRGQQLAGKNAGSEVFTTPAGVKWTAEQAQAAIDRNNLGTSRQTVEFAEAATDEFLRSLQIMKGGKAAPTWLQGVRWLNPLAKNVFSTWADSSDRYFRENVFLSHLAEGMPEAQAAKLAAESMLDYGNIPKAEREIVGQLVTFYAFQRQMALATLRAAVNNPSKLARLARLQTAAEREWSSGSAKPGGVDWYAARPPVPGSRRDLLGPRQGQRIAVTVLPGIPPLEAGVNTLLPLLRMAAPASSAEDRIQAGLDLIFTPELSAVLDIPGGTEAGWYGRFPGQWLQLAGGPDTRRGQELIKAFDLAPLPESRMREGMPSELVLTGPTGRPIQYGFRTKEGRTRFVGATYALQRAGVERTLGDVGKIMAVGKAAGLPAAAGFATGIGTPVSTSTDVMELTWKQKAILRELEAIEQSAKKE